MPGFGYGGVRTARRRLLAGPGGPVLGGLALSASSLAENTAAGAVIGAVIGKTAGSTLSLFDDAGGRFSLSGLNLVTGAVATDFETATSHSITIRETLAGAANTPRDTVLTITVTNVFEQPNLAALALSASSFTIGTPSSGTITGAVAGQAISVTGLPPGLTINGPARTWAYDGSGPAATPTLNWTGTLADSANSPFGNTQGITVGAAALSGLVIEGDSQTSTTPDTFSSSFWSYNWKTNHPAVTPCIVVAQASRTIGGPAFAGPPVEGANDGSPTGNTLLLHRAEDMARNPKAIFAMIGSNDLGTFSIARFLRDLGDWAAPIRAAGTKVLLCTPPPYDSRHPNMAVFNARRLDYLPQIRANWASYVDALVPFGDHPDINTGADPNPLIGDGVHLTAYDAVNLNGGQNKLYEVADAALSSFFDASRVGATAPYPGNWFGADSTVNLNEVVTRRYIVSGLGTGVVAACSISGAGTFRRGFAAFGTSGFTVVNGDVIELQMTGAAANSTPTTATVTIGNASDTLTLTTIGLAAQQVTYSQAGAFTSAASATSQTFANVTIAAGIPVVALTSYATAGGANNAEPATVTLVPTGGGATTTLTLRLRQIRGTAASRAASLYSGTAELPAGSYTVALNGRAFAALGTVIEVGTLQNADPVPTDAQGNTPAETSTTDHATPSVITPSLGLALAFYFVEDTTTPTAVTALSPATLIDNTTAAVSGATDGLGFAKKLAGTGSVTFRHRTGTYARGIVVWKALGT